MGTSSNVVDFFNTIWTITEPSSTGGSFTNTFDTGWISPRGWNKRIWDIPSNIHLYDSNYPPLNLWVNNETLDLVFEFAVAGIPKDKININFEDGDMILEIDSVEAEREGYTLSQKGIRTRKSKTYYSVPFAKYDVDGAKASLTDGILTITIPARDEIKPKALAIE